MSKPIKIKSWELHPLGNGTVRLIAIDEHENQIVLKYKKYDFPTELDVVVFTGDKDPRSINKMSKRTQKNLATFTILVIIVAIILLLLPSARIEFVRSEASELPYRTVLASVSGYSSSPDQTDAEPLITANGDTVGFGTIACPSEFAFGTKIKINGKEYRCNDRMNKRYRNSSEPYYFDIWFESRSEAVEFGRQNLEVKVYE